MVFKQKMRVDNILGVVLLAMMLAMVSWVLIEDFINAISRGDSGNMTMSPLFFISIAAFGLTMINTYGEWYYIYENKIEARGIFGVKKTVYYKDVKFIEDICIDIKRNGKERVYVFNDGNTKSTYKSSKQIYNTKKACFIIQKTKQLEEFIKSNLDIEIVNKDYRDL